MPLFGLAICVVCLQPTSGMVLSFVGRVGSLSLLDRGSAAGLLLFPPLFWITRENYKDTSVSTPELIHGCHKGIVSSSEVWNGFYDVENPWIPLGSYHRKYHL
jgi:hypothetical protein